MHVVSDVISMAFGRSLSPVARVMAICLLNVLCLSELPDKSVAILAEAIALYDRTITIDSLPPFFRRW